MYILSGSHGYTLLIHEADNLPTLFDHMHSTHSFNLGSLNNLVNVPEMIDILDHKVLIVI